MKKSWKHTAITVVLSGAGLLAVLILALFVYLNVTATPLHPDPAAVPSVMRAAPSPKWNEGVEQGRRIARAGLADQNLPGLSVAVGVRGQVVWAGGFGWADLDTRVPVAPEMRFRIGGASTPFLAAAVGLLLEKERLKLDTDIQMYVSAYPDKQWPVTLRHLMAHVAGVRNYGSEGDYMPSTRCDRAVDALPRFANDPLRFEPGTRYRYSAYGSILVSAAIEAASGEPFFTFMRTRIFEPLGMHDTMPDSMTESIPNRPTFYFPRFNEDPRYGPEPASAIDCSCFMGAGAFLSTASDLVRFGMAMDGGTLLQRETVAALQTPQRLASGEETGYALGWDVETVPLAGQPARMAGHDSEFIIGGSASLMTFPERGLVIAVTSNTTFADTAALSLKIAQAFAEHADSPAGK